MPRKQTSDVDKYVGQRVRQRRVTFGYSQSDLGKALGLTFQQIQKNEKGVNRIPAGRLFEIASILGVDVGYFYPPGQAAVNDIPSFVPTADELTLCLKLRGMANAKRKAIIALIEAEQESTNEPDGQTATAHPLEHAGV